MRGFVPGVVLIVVVLGALINRMLGGAQSLSLILWAVAGVAIIVILTRAYVTGAGIDLLGSETGPEYMVRTHILLNVVPLTYFPLAHGLASGNLLELIYLIPVIVFFITGVRTWKLCHGLFGTKLYKIFQIGNRQMLFLFPGAFVLDMAGWPMEDPDLFSRLMHVYFIVHFMLTGVTVSLLARDLHRYVTGPSASSKAGGMP